MNRTLVSSGESTRMERWLVFAMLAILPMQSNLSTIKGYSILFICFGVLFLYQIWLRPRTIFRSATHTSFIAGFVFIFLCYFIEMLHKNADQYYIIRMAFMFLGGVVIASLCRGKKALNTAILGYMVGTAILATILIATSYGKVSSLTKYNNMANISYERGRAFSDKYLQDNLNQIAFFASQGAIIAFAFALKTSGIRRALVTCIGLLCTVATFLPMSRSGIIILALGLASVGYVYGIVKPHIIGMVAVIVMVIVFAVPDVALKRMKFSSERNVATGGFEDSRAMVYRAVLHHLPEYIWTGVGFGNFYAGWAKNTQFYVGHGEVTGPHNVFAQATINWGILSFLALIGVVWRTYKIFPKNDCIDSIYLCLVGLSVSALAWSMTTNCIEGKEFSVVLGFLAAADLWSLTQRNSKRLAKTPRARLIEYRRRIESTYRARHVVTPGRQVWR
jgi:hypothetical protein